MGLGDIKAVARFYIPMLEAKNISSGSEDIRHVIEMCHKLQNFKNEEKANRWLGFIQGVMWVFNIRTIEEMRRDNSGE